MDKRTDKRTDVVIREIHLHDLRMPLIEPYPSAITTIEALETMVIEVHGSDGSVGFGEAAIVEGYTHETREGGWRFCREHAARAIGQAFAPTKTALLEHRADHSHAVSAMVAAIEMADGHPLLAPPAFDYRIPLLAPVNSKQPAAIEAEIERLLASGFLTLKVKVGFAVQTDIARVRLIQKCNAGRAKLRLDGNQGYPREDALAFVRALDPRDIELLEQPCNDRDWDAAVAVARIAPVPMMLDESIYASSDIDRAANLRAADFIKLKLVKAGGLAALCADLERITACGMRRVLGNGVASEINCWMEGVIAHRMIDNAGEMNGYLKPVDRLFATPLPFSDGCMVIPTGFTPRLDPRALEQLSVRRERFASVVC